MQLKRMLRTTLLGAGLLVLPLVQALEVNIADFLPYVELEYGGERIRVMRIQDQDHRLRGGFAKTSRPCPPFCFQPMQVAPGVKTVGELEVVKFLAGPLKSNTGILVDARTPEWFTRGTIPGAVNIPFTVFDSADTEGMSGEGDASQEAVRLEQAFKLFGVKPRVEEESSFLTKLFSARSGDQSPWDYSEAKTLLLFCNGPWCGQSPRAITGLLHLGYPPEKLLYYRGGMQLWQLGGFTTVVPKS